VAVLTDWHAAPVPRQRHTIGSRMSGALESTTPNGCFAGARIRVAAAIKSLSFRLEQPPSGLRMAPMSPAFCLGIAWLAFRVFSS
jgi:hypothetical protein